MHFNSKDFEFASIFMDLGLSRAESLILVYFIKTEDDEATSSKIQMTTFLTQPEVSVALSKLSYRDWVSRFSDYTQVGRGRPKNIYQLTETPEDIIDHLGSAILKKYKSFKHQIATAKSMLDEMTEND